MTEQQKEFFRIRREGFSFDDMEKILKVDKSVLLEWSKELAEQFSQYLTDNSESKKKKL